MLHDGAGIGALAAAEPVDVMARNKAIAVIDALKAQGAAVQSFIREYLAA